MLPSCSAITEGPVSSCLKRRCRYPVSPLVGAIALAGQSASGSASAVPALLLSASTATDNASSGNIEPVLIIAIAVLVVGLIILGVLTFFLFRRPGTPARISTPPFKTLTTGSSEAESIKAAIRKLENTILSGASQTNPPIAAKATNPATGSDTTLKDIKSRLKQEFDSSRSTLETISEKLTSIHLTLDSLKIHAETTSQGLAGEIPASNSLWNEAFFNDPALVTLKQQLILDIRQGQRNAFNCLQSIAQTFDILSADPESIEKTTLIEAILILSEHFYLWRKDSEIVCQSETTSHADALIQAITAERPKRFRDIAITAPLSGQPFKTETMEAVSSRSGSRLNISSPLSWMIETNGQDGSNSIYRAKVVTE